MSEEKQDLTGLVESIVLPLVDNEDDVEVVSHEEDTGKVIGRQGRVIKSIRTLARAAASRNDMRVEVEILD